MEKIYNGVNVREIEIYDYMIRTIHDEGIISYVSHDSTGQSIINKILRKLEGTLSGSQLKSIKKLRKMLYNIRFISKETFINDDTETKIIRFENIRLNKYRYIYWEKLKVERWNIKEYNKLYKEYLINISNEILEELYKLNNPFAIWLKSEHNYFGMERLNSFFKGKIYNFDYIKDSELLGTMDGYIHFEEYYSSYFNSKVNNDKVATNVSK